MRLKLIKFALLLTALNFLTFKVYGEDQLVKDRNYQESKNSVIAGLTVIGLGTGTVFTRRNAHKNVGNPEFLSLFDLTFSLGPGASEGLQQQVGLIFIVLGAFTMTHGIDDLLQEADRNAYYNNLRSQQRDFQSSTYVAARGANNNAHTPHSISTGDDLFTQIVSRFYLPEVSYSEKERMVGKLIQEGQKANLFDQNTYREKANISEFIRDQISQHQYYEYYDSSSESHDANIRTLAWALNFYILDIDIFESVSLAQRMNFFGLTIDDLEKVHGELHEAVREAINAGAGDLTPEQEQVLERLRRL